MSKEVQALERAALAAHARGDSWGQFWHRHGDDVRKAEPWKLDQFHRLRNHLLHCLVSGSTSGELPVDDDEPGWERDDAPAPSDSSTRARCLLPLAPLPAAGHRQANTERRAR